MNEARAEVIQRVIRAQFIFKTTGAEGIVEGRPDTGKRRLLAVTFANG